MFSLPSTFAFEILRYLLANQIDMILDESDAIDVFDARRYGFCERENKCSNSFVRPDAPDSVN